MAILLSIKPKFASLIYEGDKSFEIRKVIPNCHSGQRILIYETSPVCAITGYCLYGGFICLSPEDAFSEYSQYLGVSQSEFNEYCGNRSYIVLWRLLRPCHFSFRYDLKIIGLNHPPQSFQYISDDDLFTWLPVKL